MTNVMPVINQEDGLSCQRTDSDRLLRLNVQEPRPGTTKRMDYIEGGIWRKIFQNNLEKLQNYYKSVRMQMKTFPEEDLLHNQEPTLNEEELLLICSDKLSENIFHGFSVRQLVNGNMLSFQFESMISLIMMKYTIFFGEIMMKYTIFFEIFCYYLLSESEPEFDIFITF